MQFFTDHQIAASSPAPSPAAGGKRKRDDSEMCDVELRAPVKRVELESHQHQGNTSFNLRTIQNSRKISTIETIEFMISSTIHHILIFQI